MFFSLVLALMVSLHSSDAAEWSYEGAKGPDHWIDVNENCGGEKQSPINIDTDNVVDMEVVEWTFTNYEEMVDNQTNIINNGHTIQVNPGTSTADKTRISGGGLPSTYSFFQLHFHWAETNDAGSEHTRNGNHYPVEMHLVHWDSGNYFLPPAAIAEPQGLAVLGVWVEIGEENPGFNSIIDAISETNVLYKSPSDNKFVFPESKLFRLQDLLPADTSTFYRYNGSLTTPGCYESVLWTVFSDPIQMSAEQINAFRAAFQNDPPSSPPDPIPENYTTPATAPEDTPIGFNYRPVQDIGDRTVYQTFATLVAPSTAPSTTAGASSQHLEIYSVFLLLIVHLVYFGLIQRFT